MSKNCQIGLASSLINILYCFSLTHAITWTMNTTELYEIWSIQPGIMFIIRVRMLCLCFVSDICMKKVPGGYIFLFFFYFSWHLP